MGMQPIGAILRELLHSVDRRLAARNKAQPKPELNIRELAECIGRSDCGECTAEECGCACHLRHDYES